MSENIYGIHAVNSILANSPERLIEVFVLKGREDKRLQPLLNELHALGIAVQFVNRQTLDKKSICSTSVARSPSRCDCACARSERAE